MNLARGCRRGMRFDFAQCERMWGGEAMETPVPRRRPGPSFDVLESEQNIAWEARRPASSLPPGIRPACQRPHGNWAPAFAGVWKGA